MTNKKHAKWISTLIMLALFVSIIPAMVLATSTPDTQAPSVPSALNATSASTTQVTLTWTASTDNVGVTKYEIYNNRTLVGSVTGSPPATTFTATNLTPATMYLFNVKAFDAAGRVSAASANLRVSTWTSSSPLLKVGDYIQFGKYNDAAILWRVINMDANGDPVLLADRILTIKPFDAGGNYYPAPNTSEVDSRRMYGSNFYLDSNIRQWLNSNSPNSGENVINWTQNDPNANNLRNPSLNWSTDGVYAGDNNPYDTEKGFLADGNFTAGERSLIKPLTHKVLINASFDNTLLADGGLGFQTVNTRIEAMLQNYDNAMYRLVTDQVFMLSVKQLKEWVYDNRTVLGNEYHFARPTLQAVQSSTKKPLMLNATSNWLYWLNTPCTTPSCKSQVRVVDAVSGSIGFVPAVDPDLTAVGVRPAIVLRASSANFITNSSGTATSPHVILSEALTTPNTESLHFSADAKTLNVIFDRSIASVDKSKIAIFNGSPNRLASTAFNATISGKRLAITFSDARLLFRIGTRITFTEGAVTDSNGNANKHIAEKTLDASRFINLASTKMNDTNTGATLSFATSDRSGPIGTLAIYPLLNNLNDQIEISEDGGLTWSSSNIDTATLAGNTINVTFNNQITNHRTTMRIKAGAVSFTAFGKASGTLNGQLLIPLDLTPLPVSADVDASNYTVTIKFSEPITSPLTMNNLPNRISLSRDGTNFGAAGSDVMWTKIDRDLLQIHLKDKLTGSSNKIRIAANSIQDARRNYAPLFTTDQISADEIGPVANGVGFKATDKTITVYFNENIYIENLPLLTSSIRYNTDQTLSSASITSNNNLLVIRHTTSGITSSGNGGINNIIIPQNLIKDLAGNWNLGITTGAADVSGPTVSRYWGGGTTTMTIRFNEAIYPMARTIPLTAISLTRGTGNSAVTRPLSDATWRTATTSITVDGIYMYINNLRTPLLIGDRVSINRDLVRDLMLNRNAAIQFTIFTDKDDAVATLNTADSGLNAIHDVLQRIRELAEVAEDGSISSVERSAMQTEVNALVGELTTIATNTSYNSTPLIGSTPFTLRTAGASPSNTPRTFVFSSATPSALGLSTVDISTTTAAQTAVTAITAAISNVSSARTSIGNERSFLQSMI